MVTFRPTHLVEFRNPDFGAENNENMESFKPSLTNEMEKGKRVLVEDDPVIDQTELDDIIDNFMENDNGDYNDRFEDNEDNDFSLNDVDDVDDLILDDIMFEENIDKEVEWQGYVNDDQIVIANSSTDHGLSSEEDFDSDLSSDNEDVDRRSNVFRESELSDPQFEIEQVFGSKKLFREAVHSHAIKTRRSLKITKNDKRRIYARCMGEGCEWHINVLKIFGEESFQIREYNPNHKCGRSYHVSNVNSKWLATKFEESFRTDPNRNVKGFRNEAIRNIKCHVSSFQAYRAKQKAIKLIEGSHAEQYSKLWDYAEALREKNPGSTILMCLSDAPEGQKKFEKLYVCLNALKTGFLVGCRPIVGVDGCHLKGPHGGVLLTAVSIDPNNNPYPIAYAVVGSETKESWDWFLKLLREDLKIERDELWTFISDKQKGLIPAFEIVFPGADNRFCVRHLHGNMKTAGFRGNAFKKGLWAAAKASTIPDFNEAMKKLRELDAKCVEWLSDKPASQWSRSHFSTCPKCDILLNNICEVFNSCILEARQKPILTMLEWIREYLMTRLQQNRDRAIRKWEGKKLCPKIEKIVQKNEDKAVECIPIKSNDWKYELHCNDGSRHTVDLHVHSCSCRQWDLTGIPCKHAIAAIQAQSHDVEDYVPDCYSVKTYCKVYETPINPMSGQQLWDKTGYIPPLPPNFGRKKGRPARARRFGADEERGGRGKKLNMKEFQKLGKQKYSVKCKRCGKKGHNQRSCEWKEVLQQPEQLTEEVLQQPEELTQSADFPQPTQDGEGYNDNVPHVIYNVPITTEFQGERKMTARKRTTGGPSTFKPPRPVKKTSILIPSGPQNAKVEGLKVINRGGKKYVTVSSLQSMAKFKGDEKDKI